MFFLKNNVRNEKEIDSENISSISIIDILKSSFLSGICISLGGTVYLTVGGIIGAFLFSFGLLAIIHYKLLLYTGKCGFAETKKEFCELPIILIGNILGAISSAILIKISNPNIISIADNLIEKRLSNSLIQTFILSLFCGFIMTIVVKHAREKKFLPLLFGIPLFIMCGFIHSIADAFYYSLASFNFIFENIFICIGLYLMSVIGNFVGCNIPRLFNK